MIRSILAAIVLALAPTMAAAQLLPSGPLTPGHTVRVQTTGGVVSDGGGAAGTAAAGKNSLSEIGITNTGTPFCINDAITSGPYHAFCFGALSSNGVGGIFSYEALNGATALPLIANINGVNVPFPGSIAGLPFVTDNASLKALAIASYSFVYRAGFNGAGDGGQMIYMASLSACGNADNGYEVAPTTGTGCWIAQTGPMTDLRLWGPGGTADDTAQLIAATTALANGLKTSFACNSAFYFKNWNPSAANIKIIGTPYCSFNATATAGTSDSMLNYTGGGSLELDGITWNAPIFNYTTWALPAIQKMIRVQDSSAPTQHVVLRDDIFYGGQAALVCSGCLYVDVLNSYSYNSWSDAFSVVAAGPGAPGEAYSHSAHIHMDVHCYAGGSYCVAPMADQTALATATSDIKIKADAEFMGFINNKMCGDFTVGQASNIAIEMKCTDGWTGGMEVKVGTNPESPPSGIPAYYKAVKVDAQCLNHFDAHSGYCLWVDNANPASNPDLFGQIKASSFATFALPGNWAATNYYDYGDVVQRTSGGTAYTFIALAPGTSGAVGSAPVPPGGNCDGLAHAVYVGDGTVPGWLCVEATPAVSVIYGGAILYASKNVDLTVTALDTGFGLALDASGSSDNTIRNATIHLTAVVNNACVTDNTSDLNGFVDRLTFVSPSCVAGRTDGLTGGNSAFVLGAHTYTNTETDGGSIIHVGTTTGLSESGVAIRSRTSGDPVNLRVNGTRLAGGNGAYFIENSVWAIGQSGGSIETLTAGGGAPITFDGSSSAGSFNTLGPVGMINNASASKAGWALTGGATTTVAGRFIEPPLNATPNGTNNCNYGEVVPSVTPGAGGQPVNGWYCSTPGTGWTLF